MSPLVKYTLGRFGLFLAALLVVWPVPGLSPLVKLLVALVGSFLLSWFLLRRWRDEFSADLAGRIARRRAEQERLRAALAGEDPSGPPAGPDPARPPSPGPDRRPPPGEHPPPAE
jgi:hypothetical protein